MPNKYKIMNNKTPRKVGIRGGGGGGERRGENPCDPGAVSKTVGEKKKNASR